MWGYSFGFPSKRLWELGTRGVCVNAAAAAKAPAEAIAATLPMLRPTTAVKSGRTESQVRKLVQEKRRHCCIGSNCSPSQSDEGMTLSHTDMLFARSGCRPSSEVFLSAHYSGGTFTVFRTVEIGLPDPPPKTV